MIPDLAPGALDDLVLQQPFQGPGRAWCLALAVTTAITLLGAGLTAHTLATGIGVWGNNSPVFWAFDSMNFVFWVGIGHAGTLISAVLFLFRQRWRNAIARFAEAMTIFAVICAGIFPLIHLGRNWIFYYMIPYPNQRGLWPNFRSPLLWDMTAITAYIIGSSLFLYLGMLPDLALVRDRSHGWRRDVYALLAMGWRGSAPEWAVYHKASTLRAALIIPVAVSVHSIVAWDFAVTVVPGWHSTIFPPYFVIGAILSGVAAVITLMIVIRRAFRLEEYLTALHFDNMGKILLVISLLWSYAYFVEVQTTWYAHEPIEWEVFSFMADRYSWQLAVMLIGNSLLPIFTMCFKRLRRCIPVLLAVTMLVNVGMFIERFLIIVPSLSHKNMPFAWGSYSPSWVEISVNVAALAGFSLLFTLFAKFFPIVAVTDVRELEARKAQVPLGRAELPSLAVED